MYVVYVCFILCVICVSYVFVLYMCVVLYVVCIWYMLYVLCLWCVLYVFCMCVICCIVVCLVYTCVHMCVVYVWLCCMCVVYLCMWYVCVVFLYIVYACIMCVVYACMLCVCAVYMWVLALQDTEVRAFRNQVSPSTMWVLRIGLRFSGLELKRLSPLGGLACSALIVSVAPMRGRYCNTATKWSGSILTTPWGEHSYDPVLQTGNWGSEREIRQSGVTQKGKAGSKQVLTST